MQSPQQAPPSAVVDAAVATTCPRCATRFDCGVSAASCWCQALPALNLATRSADLIGCGCLCAACLRAAIAD